MNTEKTLSIKCASLEDTFRLGERLGAACRGGEVFELVSDLGGGKTALVRGIARAFGLADEVTSPSFTIHNIYEGQTMTIDHFDFYRLSDPGVVAEELKEGMLNAGSITLVEWGDIVHDILPQDVIRVEIEALGEMERIFHVHLPVSRSYLKNGMRI